MGTVVSTPLASQEILFHVKLFLGITNMDKRAKIDIGKLSL